jgi:transposase
VAHAAARLAAVGGGLPAAPARAQVGAFAALVPDQRILPRRAAGRAAAPTATIFERRPLPSSAASGGRAGYDGAKRPRGSKVPLAVATLGHLLGLPLTPANAQERAQGAPRAAAGQAETGETITLAYVDQGYTGDAPAAEAAADGSAREGVKLPDAKHGFVLLPRRWVVERGFAWMSRFRRRVRDDERLPERLAGLHRVAFTSLMLQQAFPPPESSLQALGAHLSGSKKAGFDIRPFCNLGIC